MSSPGRQAWRNKNRLEGVLLKRSKSAEPKKEVGQAKARVENSPARPQERAAETLVKFTPKREENIHVRVS